MPQGPAWNYNRTVETIGGPALKTPIAEPEPLLTEARVIELLGLSEHKHPARFLAKLARTGRLRVHRLSHKIRRYRPRDVEEFIRSTAQEPAAE